MRYLKKYNKFITEELKRFINKSNSGSTRWIALEVDPPFASLFRIILN